MSHPMCVGVLLLSLFGLSACSERPHRGLDCRIPVESTYIENPSITLDAWTKALERGDLEVAFLLLSEGAKADWLFNGMEREDPHFLGWRNGLGRAEREFLDLWHQHIRKHRGHYLRVPPLPRSIAEEPSLPKLFADACRVRLDELRFRTTDVRVKTLAADDGRAIFTSRNGKGRSIDVPLVYEGLSWRLDLVP